MRLDTLGLTLTAGAAALSVGAGAASAQERIEGNPNLNGIWQAMNTAYWNLEAHSAEAVEEWWELGAMGAIPAGQSVISSGDGTIPYTEEGLARHEEQAATAPAGDPEAACYLPGMPRAQYMQYPFQIVQSDDDILFVYEYADSNRIVNMGDHRIAQIDTWMGESNGYWEDDTLVVEVTGLQDDTWLDRAGNYHSNQLRVTERFTLIDENHIQYEATMEDPVAYTEPWTISMPLYRRIEPNAQLLEFKCVPFAEEFLYGDLWREDEES